MKTAFEQLTGRIVREWDELCDASGSPPFLRPGWFTTWSAAFGEGGLVLATRRRGTTLEAAMPLLRTRTGLRSPTNWHTPGFAAAASTTEREAELVESVAAKVSSLRLSFVPETSGTAAGIRTAAERLSSERLLVTSPLIQIDCRWNEFEKTLGRDMLKSMRRRRRRLEEAGSVSIDRVDGTEGLDAALDTGFAIEASGWKGANGTAISSRPETAAFYRQLAHWAASRGLLQLAFLRLDGKAIAFHFDLADDRAVYGLKGSFDQAFDRLSPGRILTHIMIQTAFEEGREMYAFLGADEPYKRDWANADDALHALGSFSRSAAGRLQHAVDAYGLPRARRAKQRVRATVGPDRKRRNVQQADSR